MFSPAQNSHSNDGRNLSEFPAAPQTKNDSGKLILLVEDNADSCTMLRTLLEMWGYRVITADDGKEAIKLAESETPSLILMDVRIPVIDGVEATRQIRRFASADELPVVFVSSHAQPWISDGRDGFGRQRLSDQTD